MEIAVNFASPALLIKYVELSKIDKKTAGKR